MKYATFAKRRLHSGIDEAVVTVSDDETGEARSAIMSEYEFDAMAAPILQKMVGVHGVGMENMGSVVIEWRPPEEIILSLPSGNQKISVALDARQYGELLRALLGTIPASMSDEYRKAREWWNPPSI